MMEAARQSAPGHSQAALVSQSFIDEVHKLAINSAMIVPVDNSGDIDSKRIFSSRYEMGSYINEQLPSDNSIADISNINMWSWLSAFYIDQLCEKAKNGSYKLWSLYRYIPDQNKWRYYRNLIQAPVSVLRKGDLNVAKLLFSDKPYKGTDAVEQLYTQEKDFITNPGLVELALRMYYDEDQQLLKPKVLGNSAGSAVRLATIISKQLSMNYDLHSMGSEQIIGLLPPEFDKWIPDLVEEKMVAVA